jgi:hypothetical protein
VSITTTSLTTNPSPTTTGYGTPDDTFPYGLKVHQPYNIAWEAKDRSIISPTPPDFTCETPLATWIPGQPDNCAYPVSNTGGSDELKGLAELALFLMIGMPLIFVSIVSCCLCCCFCRRYGSDSTPNRERVLAARARVAAQGAETRTAVEAAQANALLEEHHYGADHIPMERITPDVDPDATAIDTHTKMTTEAPVGELITEPAGTSATHRPAAHTSTNNHADDLV